MLHLQNPNYQFQTLKNTFCTFGTGISVHINNTLQTTELLYSMAEHVVLSVFLWVMLHILILRIVIINKIWIFKRKALKYTCFGMEYSICVDSNKNLKTTQML